MFKNTGMAISKNKMQFIISLQKKKTRDDEKLFLIEGDKIVKELLLSDYEIVTLIAKPEFISGISPQIINPVKEIIPVSYEELKKISSLKTPHNAMAVVKIPEVNFNYEEITKSNCVALDFIQDPGNLGTIIRSAAWFGIKNVICSHSCVDVYNSKVIQSTMGAIMHVSIIYADLRKFLAKANDAEIPVYGTMLEGESIYLSDISKPGVILLGNESRGVSQELIPLVTHKIMIPKFTDAVTGIDSLNAGMAASIVLSEFSRRKNFNC